MSKLPSVAVVVNSPGGSPVQSHLIFSRIRQLAKEKDKRVYVFCEDVAASGGYFLALAGDEIYADPSSIIGSIGVISAGFGLHKLIDRFGVERRVYTTGKDKGLARPVPARAAGGRDAAQRAAARRARRLHGCRQGTPGGQTEPAGGGAVHRRVLVRPPRPWSTA